MALFPRLGLVAAEGIDVTVSLLALGDAVHRERVQERPGMALKESPEKAARREGHPRPAAFSMYTEAGSTLPDRSPDCACDTSS